MHTLRNYLETPTAPDSQRVMLAYISALEEAVWGLLSGYPEQLQETFESCVRQALEVVDNESEPEADQAIEAELASLLRGLPLA